VDTAAARFVSSVTRRMMRISMASQVISTAPSIAPTNHDSRVATAARRWLTERMSPVSTTS
jgi:hypothetical protein